MSRIPVGSGRPPGWQWLASDSRRRSPMKVRAARSVAGLTAQTPGRLAMGSERHREHRPSWCSSQEIYCTHALHIADMLWLLFNEVQLQCLCDCNLGRRCSNLAARRGCRCDQFIVRQMSAGWWKCWWVRSGGVCYEQRWRAPGAPSGTAPSFGRHVRLLWPPPPPTSPPVQLSVRPPPSRRRTKIPGENWPRSESWPASRQTGFQMTAAFLHEQLLNNTGLSHQHSIFANNEMLD